MASQNLIVYDSVNAVWYLPYFRLIALTCIANLIASFSFFSFFLFYKSLYTSRIRFSKFNKLQLLTKKKKKLANKCAWLGGKVRG